VTDGQWFSTRMLRQDPDLASLQGIPEFERLVSACEELRSAAQAKAESRRLTVVPEATSPLAKLPLLIALHGNGSNASAELDHWAAAAASGWLLMLPQSTQVETPDGYSWWDRDWAVREALRHIGEVTSQHPVDPSRIVVGGFSAGAGLAIRLALGGEPRARGFIAVAPALLTPEEIGSLLAAKVPSGLRGYLLVGDRDGRSGALAQAARSLLESHGVPCRLETHADMGHSYPGAFRESLDRAFEFILGGSL
jgi:predicted esterase